MDLFRVVFLSLVQGILLFGSSVADDDVVPDSATPVKFDFAQWCKVGDYKFMLESVTLAEVIRALGSGQIVNVNASDPGNADPLWAVYYRSGKNVVRFEADGDMGGAEHRITDVSIGPVSDFPVGKLFPAIKEDVEFRFGRIGMGFSDLERQMGKAGLQKNMAAYVYRGTTKMPFRSDILGASKVYDVSGYLSVEVIEGKVVRMGVSHITTF